jgi:hypothetical protein
MQTPPRSLSTAALKYTLICGLPVWLAACDAGPLEQPPQAAYEECQYEMELTGVELDCDDDESSWYKTKKYKSKYASATSSSSGFSKSGYGNAGASKSSGG